MHIRRYTALAPLALVLTLLNPTARSIAQGARGNSVPVSDPTLGVAQGSLPLLPGWRGEAHIDRTSDPLAYAIGTLTADVRSPDGAATIQMLAVPFHTYNVTQQFGSVLPGNPAHQRNASLGRFRSTEDLLKQRILPALGLNASSAQFVSMPEEARERGRGQAKVPGPIVDSSVAVVPTEKGEVAVLAFTSGADAGTPREFTTTYILACTAPAGKAMGILTAQQALPPVQHSAAWEQANERYLAEWRQALQEESARSTREFQRGNEAILAQGHANIAAMQARGAERDRAFVEHEQRTSDLGANFRGYLSGTSTTFKWCGAGGSTYTVDDVRPPAPGLRRCD